MNFLMFLSVTFVIIELSTTQEISEICFVVETKGKDFKPCIFPFKYRGETHKTCTKVTDPDEKLWCSTKVDADGNHVNPGGYWGYCGQDCDQAALKAQAESSNSATIKEEKRNDLSTYFNDKIWPDMWYLNRGNDLDMNVYEAWADGYSGKGVVVTIMDDGVEWDHPDLKDNYDEEASIDLNDNDYDPYPRNNENNNNTNRQGTRVAGIVSAVANNSLCGVGIAFKAKIGGIRILDGDIRDEMEGKALRFNRNYIDIYSAGWGPDDNGMTVDGPGPKAKSALREGIEHGRNGKGSVFVWAAGTGGKYFDNCNCDGYTTSIYTLSITSTSEKGTVPWYTEFCSSTIATTFSSGDFKTERKVLTTDIHGGCTDRFSGTSASSAIATGIVALSLEANPDLTWRDIQHLVIRTARPQLTADDWSTNSAGRKFSHWYGFGLMDAGKLVKLAKKWKNVPKHFNCTTDQNNPSEDSSTILAASEKSYLLDASGCSGIKYIEHIQIHIDLNSEAERGDLSVRLQSPAGTVSTLLKNRPHDEVRTGFQLFEKWPMMSVHYWGESVLSKLESVWKLTITNSGDRPAVLSSWKITFYGTKEDPQP